ncbi:MAG: glycosyltransferase family 2 protein [Planctomycetota bacterium]
MIRLSGCVISFNEEDRIEACLRSLGFCDEILVLDSHSTDRTREFAGSLGARVETGEFLGHSRQKQAAVDLAKNDWILSIDCDEIVTEGLAREIRREIAATGEGVVGYRMPRRNVYLGRTMRHGLFWPDRKLRLFDRRKARWGGTDPHDQVMPMVPGSIIEIREPILHDSYRSFQEHRDTVDRFAKSAARAMADEGRSAGALSPWTRSALALTKGLLLKAGFMDGWRGVLAACMSAKYDYIKYRELRALERKRWATGAGG